MTNENLSQVVAGNRSFLQLKAQIEQLLAMAGTANTTHRGLFGPPRQATHYTPSGNLAGPTAPAAAVKRGYTRDFQVVPQYTPSGNPAGRPVIVAHPADYSPVPKPFISRSEASANGTVSIRDLVRHRSGLPPAAPAQPLAYSPAAIARSGRYDAKRLMQSTANNSNVVDMSGVEI